ncbi:MAG: hypothetical protein ABSB32_04900 [Thermodesulfobacteriota bacterium]|jgi:hypothetical protein
MSSSILQTRIVLDLSAPVSYEARASSDLLFLSWVVKEVHLPGWKKTVAIDDLNDKCIRVYRRQPATHELLN